LSHFIEHTTPTGLAAKNRLSAQEILVVGFKKWGTNVKSSPGYLFFTKHKSFFFAFTLLFFLSSLIIPELSTATSVSIPLFSLMAFSALQRTKPQGKAKTRLKRRREKFYFSDHKGSQALYFLYDSQKEKFVDASEKTLDLFDYDLQRFLMLGMLDVSPVFQAQGVSSRALAQEKFALAFRRTSPSLNWVFQNRNGVDIPVQLTLSSVEFEAGSFIKGEIADLSFQKPLRQMSRGQQTEELAGLALAGASIASSLDLNEVLSVVARQLSQMLDMQICLISNTQAGKRGLHPCIEFVSRIDPPGASEFRPRSLANEFQSINSQDKYQILQKRIDDTSLSPSELKALEGAGIRSLLQMPLMAHGKTIGVAELQDTREARRFSEHEVYLAQTLCQQAAIAIDNARLFQSAHRQLEELKILNEVAVAGTKATDEDELISKATQVIREGLYPDNFGVLMVDEGGQDLFLHASYESSEEIKKNRIPLGSGVTGAVAATGIAKRIGDIRDESNYLGLDKSTRSELCVPMKIGERSIGVINAESQKINHFSKADEQLLSTFAGQLASGIERLRKQQADQHQLQELSVLHAIANAASIAKNEKDLLERATDIIGERLFPDKFGFLMLSPHGEFLIVDPAYRGISSAMKKTKVPMDGSISGQVATSGKAVRIGDVRKETKYLEAKVDMRSELTVPIWGGQKVLGVINAESAEIDAFSEADMHLLNTIAKQLGTAIDKLRLFESERLQRYQAETLQKVAAILSAATESNRVSDLILDQLKHVVPYDSSSIQIVSGEKLIIRAVAGKHQKNILGQELSIRDDKVAHPILNEQSTVLRADVSDDPDWLKVPGSAKVKSWIGAPLIVRGACIGILTVDGYKENQFDESDAQLVSSFAIHAGIAIENSRLFEALEDSYTQTVTALANAIDVRDSYTIGHSQRLAKLAVECAQVLQCTSKETEDTRWAALLHDIGKIGIPDDILRKPSSLDASEMDVIRQHPEIGARIVEPIKNLSHLAPIIRAHQEQFDGKGYPDGLSGSQIPVVARVISVADAYVAMTDERVYRGALSRSKATSELKKYAGTQFDPKVVDAFLQVIKSHK
jgi:putative nucleotidyltransferase with HDIG domain